MKYLTTSFSIGLDINAIPSSTRQVNGMATKTRSVLESLGCTAYFRATDLKGTGPVLVEPLFFKPHMHLDEDRSPVAARIDALRAYEGRKILLCSEMEVLRWSGSHRENILEMMDLVLASCEYQRSLMEACGVKVDGVVYEPVNEDLFYPVEKENMVVAVGSTNHVKNIEAIIKVFEGLEGGPYKRVFIGSPIVWGSMAGLRYDPTFEWMMDRYYRLQELSDEFYHASPATLVSYMLSKARYYLNFAYHEVCCRTAMEALLSGTGVLAGMHPVFKEYPVVASGLMPDACVDLILEERPGEPVGARKWALENVSYSAFSKSVKRLINEN